MWHSWNIAFKNRNFVMKFVISFLALALLLYFFAWFLNYVELRQGHVFYDPVLEFFKPRDVSYYIFGITYASAIGGIIYASRTPYLVVHLCQMYFLLTVFRVITLFFVPLNPPEGIITLKDAFLDNTFYANGGNLKDLFFSGHTATVFLFVFFVDNKILKLIFLIAALAVAFGVMIQHVHYSYDVLVAPLFSFLSYRLVKKYVKFHQGSLAILV